MKTDESLVKIGADQQAKALAYPEQAKALVVTNDKELEAVDNFVKGGIALMKEIRAGYDDIISDAHSTWKGAIAKRDHYLNPVSEGVKIAKNEKMAPYMEEQARKVREAEEARRKALADAEAAEIAAEAERQAKARQALHDGDQAKAEKILAEEPKEIIPEQVDIPVTKKLEGTHARVTWEWEVVDIEKIPRDFLMLDTVAVNKIVQVKKEHAHIPGIRIFQKTGISSRG